VKRLYVDEDTIPKIILLIFGLVIIWKLASTSCYHNRCESLCLDLGYAGFRYTPESSGRTGNISPESCHCLSQEETELKNIIPKGVEIDM